MGFCRRKIRGYRGLRSLRFVLFTGGEEEEQHCCFPLLLSGVEEAGVLQPSPEQVIQSTVAGEEVGVAECRWVFDRPSFRSWRRGPPHRRSGRQQALHPCTVADQLVGIEEDSAGVEQRRAEATGPRGEDQFDRCGSNKIS